MKKPKQVDAIIKKLERIQRRQAALSRERVRLVMALESGRHEGSHLDLYISPEGTKVVAEMRNMRRLIEPSLFFRCTHMMKTNKKASIVAKRKGKKQ